MLNFGNILSDLQAAIAVVSARHRSLTPLLVAVWGRIGRMRVRLERLVALWRAGILPKQRRPRDQQAGKPTDRPARAKQSYPSTRGWLVARVWEAGAFRSQLENLLSREECVAFLAAVPQALRILRPLCHMLRVETVPEVIRKPRPPAPVVATEVRIEPTFKVTEPSNPFLPA